VRTDDNDRVVRRAVRALALAPAALVVLSAAPVLAAPPEQWPAPEPVSTLQTLLVLVGIPVTLFVVISLLVYVPSMARGQKYTPGLAWRSENEWFGGPRGGVEAADQKDAKALEGVAAGTDRGGSSARW
jgi:hypothetical protein